VLAGFAAKIGRRAIRRMCIIVDAKVVEEISNHERGQMMNYLRITGLPIGLLFNFRYVKLQWERLVLTGDAPNPDGCP
jgi:PD-(D/E)XK nuclease superfamily